MDLLAGLDRMDRPDLLAGLDRSDLLDLRVDLRDLLDPMDLLDPQVDRSDLLGQEVLKGLKGLQVPKDPKVFLEILIYLL